MAWQILPARRCLVKFPCLQSSFPWSRHEFRRSLACRHQRVAGFAAAAYQEPPAGKPKTYYDILQLTRRAKPEDVKDAYKKMAKKFHPDMNMDNPDEAEERFKEVQEAHATLIDPWKRALYDQDLQFGSMAQQEVDKEKWTEHWDRETPDEREARKDRYRRYAAEERNDLPPAPFPVHLTPFIFFGVAGGIFYICIKAPEWFDGANEPGYCDPMFDDRTVPLVRAFHDPVLNRWERLAADADPPSPRELYTHYKRVRPDLMMALDWKSLPKVSLTVLQVPRSDAVRAVLRAPAMATA